MSRVIWFGDTRCLDLACSGGKGASLAAMTAALLPVPPGFVVPADALEDRKSTRLNSSHRL